MLDEKERILKQEERKNTIFSALGLFETKTLHSIKEKQNPVSIFLRKRIVKPRFFEDFESSHLQKLHKNQTKTIKNFIHHATPEKSYSNKKGIKIRKVSVQNNYGCIKGISVGDTWSTRVECSRAGIHRPTIAGIHAGRDGAYSVAVSGEYEDDQDNGYCFTYTGSGGRDLSGTKINKNWQLALQTKDQSPNGSNASLIRSIVTRNPVRVIRGHKLNSPFAPKTGYRYDGLYTVEKFWTSIGKSGFLVYKFLMKRCPYQPPAPWDKLKSPKNKIKIVKLRKKRPHTAIMNVSGRLSMSNDGQSLANNCQLNEMKLNVNSNVKNTLTNHLPTVLIQGECKVQLNRTNINVENNTNVNRFSPHDNTPNQTCIIKLNKKMADDKENNRVIIKTRWRRSRLSLPNVKSKPIPGISNENPNRIRSCKKRSFCDESSQTKRLVNSSTKYEVPPSIELFDVPYEKSYKWSLFASEAEIKKFQKFRRSNQALSHSVVEENFRGFERKGSFNKVMILGFLINDLENK